MEISVKTVQPLNKIGSFASTVFSLSFFLSAVSLKKLNTSRIWTRNYKIWQVMCGQVMAIHLLFHDNIIS